MGTKKTSKKTTKADFVRNLPPSIPAKEVIARAKAAGLSVSKTYVYLVRGHAKTKASPKRRAPAGRRGASVARPIATMSSAEDLLKAVAAEVGLGRAMVILAGERARLRAVIGS
jgi:hypothetical protein